MLKNLADDYNVARGQGILDRIECAEFKSGLLELFTVVLNQRWHDIAGNVVPCRVHQLLADVKIAAPDVDDDRTGAAASEIRGDGDDIRADDLSVAAAA